MFTAAATCPALSNVDALRPSMTTRTALRDTVSVPGEDPEPCVPLAPAAAQACPERGQGERLEIPDERHEDERRRESSPARREQCGEEHAERDAEADGDPDPPDLAHGDSV